MEAEADPCEDLFHFVCANFESAYPTSVSYMDAFAKRVKRSFRTMINVIQRNKSSSVEHHPLVAYRSCMAEYKSGEEYLASLLRNDDEMADLWRKVPNKTDAGSRLGFLLTLSLERGSPVFLGTGVARNTFTEQRNTLRLKVDMPKADISRRTVQDIIQYVSRAPSWESALEVSQSIVTTLRGARSALKDVSLSDRLPQLVKAERIGEFLVGMPVELFLAAVSEASIRGFDQDSHVFTTDGLALKYLTTYLRTVRPDTFIYTVRFVVAESVLITSTSAITDIYDISPTAAYRYRMVRCADLSLMLLPTLSEFGFFRSFLIEKRDVIPADLFPSLIEEFPRVHPYSNMERKTQSMLRQALSTTTIIPGRDPGYSDIVYIRSKFLDLRFEASDFTGWVMNAWRVRSLLEAEAIMKQDMLPANSYSLDLNARVYYDASEDVLRVLPGLLLSPFNVSSRPSAFNFGHLGTYVAEALAGAATPEGLSGVASKLSYPRDDLNTYMKALDCLSRERVPADKARSSVKEALDLLTSLIGVRVAYKSWEEWNKGGRSSSATPTVPHVRSDEQAFFVGFCLRQCGVDDGAPSGSTSRRDRCNVPLRHMPEFAAAFGCSAKGSPMVASNQCA
ncbi:uncharacterized protein LOC144125639 [Amblyomma americanum]